MNREELKRRSLELLETEEEIIRCQNTKRKALPDVKAAKKRVAQAKSTPIKGLILILITVAWFFLVRPNLESWKWALVSINILGWCAAMLLFILQFLQWPLMVFFAWLGISCLREKPASSDRNAESIYRQSKRFNEELDQREAALREDQEKLARELCELAGVNYRAASPKYFFQIPFDSRKDYRTIKDGMEFYTDSDFGNTVCAGPPFLHDPKLPGLYQGYMRFDGFYDYAKGCKASEILNELYGIDYVVVYLDEAYLKAHPNETCWLYGIYDTQNMPTKDRAYFKMKPTKLETWIEALATAWKWSGTWGQSLLASGLAAYEPFFGKNRSSVPDHRDENQAKIAAKFNYSDLSDVQERRDRSDHLVLFNSYICSLLEKGIYLTDNSGKRTLLLALVNYGVHIPEIAYNISSYDYESWSDFHGWIASVGLKRSYANVLKMGAEARPATMISRSESWYGEPGKASTIDFMTKYLKTELALFDPLMERPKYLTDEQFRYWMNCWYRVYAQQHQPAKEAK